jgi:HTH-type transcriptional regulator/antitoxin HigA
VTEKRIREFVARDARAADAIWRWVDVAESAAWGNPADLKATFVSASFVGDLTVFNVGGNKYRIAAFVHPPQADRVYQEDRRPRGVRKMRSLTETIDVRRYGRLLAKAVPRVITTPEENERALAIVESLIEKGERNMTPEEDALLDLVTNLIRDYETRAYPPRRKSEPHEIVTFLFEQHGLAAKDLWPVIGSNGRVSEILTGKRSISKDQAKKLAHFFHVGVDLFI